MKTIVQTVKGAREFYPEDMAQRNWLYAALKEVSTSYGYLEYDGPYLEKIDLYAAKSGEELVKEQSFVFPDRGGELITLRPELTPSLARMVAQRQNSLIYPIRWWSFGPFWRYERPQKGRSREFFQWNIDLIGASSPEADAELVSVAVMFLRRVGLKSNQVRVLVNNRRLMDSELHALDIAPEMKPSIFRLIDRREKLQPAAWKAMALDMGLTIDQFSGLQTMLANKDLWQKSEELVCFFKALEALGVQNYVEYDPQIIRGLDYYTGTVFEARDFDGEFRSILGGGRYDNLVSDVGGDQLQGVGFAMGDMVIGLVLQKYGCIPDNLLQNAPVLVTVFNQELLPASFSFATYLREHKIKVVSYPEEAKLNKQFRFGDRNGFRFVVVIGPDEETQQKVTLKDLQERTQQTLSREAALKIIKQSLAETRAV